MEITGAWRDELVGRDMLNSGWAFTTCLKCRGQAWRAPDGAVHCPPCEEKAERLYQFVAGVRAGVLGSLARRPSLRAIALAGTALASTAFAAVPPLRTFNRG